MDYQNVIKQKQPRTTYTSELRQRNLSVVKDYFLCAKIRSSFITSKFFYNYLVQQHYYMPIKSLSGRILAR